jgi:hypothetical protein
VPPAGVLIQIYQPHIDANQMKSLFATRGHKFVVSIDVVTPHEDSRWTALRKLWNSRGGNGRFIACCRSSPVLE